MSSDWPIELENILATLVDNAYNLRINIGQKDAN